MKKILHTIAAAAVLAALASCEHKELCYDHPHTIDVKVLFDWRNAPGASPASMALYLFPEDGGEALRYDFTDREGGYIRLPSGTYEAICLNSDTENITYRNTESRETFEVTTRTTTLLSNLAVLGVRSESAPRAEGTEEERIALASDTLWTDRAGHIELNTTELTITLYPALSVYTYTVEITGGENLAYVSGISGALSGMAGGLSAGISAMTEERVTVPFDAAVSADNAVVTGRLTVFGHCPTERNTHLLTLYAVLSDGSKWYYTYDVTDQIHAAQGQREVHIALDGLPVPKPIINGGGFQPSVDEWQDMDIPIEM